MAVGPTTQIVDVVVPEQYTEYLQQETEQKSRLVEAGVMVRSGFLDNFLSSGGLTVNVPSWRDLDDDLDNVSTDDTADRIALTQASGAATIPTMNDSVPFKIETSQEIAVRMNRNQSWSASKLTAELAGSDPLAAILSRTSGYWARRLQAAFIATWMGVARDNAANDSGDYFNDIADAAFSAGTTDFSAEALMDTQITMGDSFDSLTTIMVHSFVYNRMRKNNLIDFIPDARGEVNIPTFQGLRVVVDDGMPTAGDAIRDDGTPGVTGIYTSWLFGPGAMQWGSMPPADASELGRDPSAGNGGGQDTLYTRQQWCLHPTGHAYTGTAPNGGPSNATTANQLNSATSWDRVYPERKQIDFAILVTREA